MILLNGAQLSEKILSQIKRQVSQMKKKPVLAMVLIGDDPASKIYVDRKKVFCEKAGIGSQIFALSEKTSEKQVIDIIGSLNRNKNISAIMVQLPLPKHIDKNKVTENIDPKKDADCLHPLNFGRFMQVGENYSVVAPATPLGIIKLLEEYKIPIAGKYAVVVGRSNIVGKPIAQILLNRDATVTICHSRTKNLKSYTQKADILVVAAGKSNLIKADMVKKGVVVVDVGMNRAEDNTRANSKNEKILSMTRKKKISIGVFGDVDFKSVSKKASFITPVPGGVGPMTIAMLLREYGEVGRKIIYFPSMNSASSISSCFDFLRDNNCLTKTKSPAPISRRR